jgi:hypothetical protein
MAAIGADLPILRRSTNGENFPAADLRGSANKRPPRVKTGHSMIRLRILMKPAGYSDLKAATIPI